MSILSLNLDAREGPPEDGPSFALLAFTCRGLYFCSKEVKS